MNNATRDENGVLATVTHARLRVAQGDLEGARELLGRILKDDPGDPAAGELLERISGMEGSVSEEEPVERLSDAVPATADELAGGFRRALATPAVPPEVRIERLQRYLAKIKRLRRRTDA